MRLQIDTKALTIKVNETVNLGELIETLDKLLPEGWKEFSLLKSGKIIYWPQQPTIIYQPYEPVIPYWQKLPVITCSSFNVEINA